MWTGHARARSAIASNLPRPQHNRDSSAASRSLSSSRSAIITAAPSFTRNAALQV
jgi:hypothetical protein